MLRRTILFAVYSCAVMGLKEALRLKSFEPKEFEIRATRTPKGDPPYLSVVQGNLYQFREPKAPENQGGSAGQGGSGSAPVAQIADVAPVQAMVVVGDAKGKESGSIGTKGSGSKFVIEDEGVHLSVGDEGERDEGVEKGSDDKDEDEADEGEPTQVSLKRKRAVSSKSGPKLKQVKKKKTDSKVITLDDDDQVTEFFTAGGILENLDAHLHGGRTPRDRPVNIPPNLLLRLGSGGVEDMDSARALEKYVPEWPLTNKDRIVDALTAKMALFHLGTLAEHSHYRKMSGPELGNALMLNQAQSNSLVVETYKRWIESGPSCHKLQREVAALRSEDNVRSKTKQELSSLRSQVDRLKGQVLVAKEVNKSSQASAAAAHEARDKALQDLESFKLKYADLEKNLADTEKRCVAELKEMKASYDQLLADHHRLMNGTLKTVSFTVRLSVLSSFFFFEKIEFYSSADKDEVERARDRAIESHKATIDEAKGMLTRTDGEMVEVYAQVSELMLTKQWFLTEGIAWVVKLVHQSP
ncbi:hypothetical protein HanIR_Chr03g0128521 [Helianthus annuus]|nr:hypothetical protein HanIR_Chr03g0128521 [Helianthus annuus]